MTDRRTRAEEALRRLQGSAGDLLAGVAALRASRKHGTRSPSPTPASGQAPPGSPVMAAGRAAAGPLDVDAAGAISPGSPAVAVASAAGVVEPVALQSPGVDVEPSVAELDAVMAVGSVAHGHLPPREPIPGMAPASGLDDGASAHGLEHGVCLSPVDGGLPRPVALPSPRGLDALPVQGLVVPAARPAVAIDAPGDGSSAEAAEDDADEVLEAQEDTPWAGLSDIHREDFLSEMEDLVSLIASRLDQGVLPLPGTPQWEEVARQVHTLKGTANVVGAKRAGWWLHRMEASMEDWGRASPEEQSDPVHARELQESLQRRFSRAQDRLSHALMPPSPLPAAGAVEVSSEPAPSERIQADKVKVDAGQVDRLITEANEACLSGGDIAARSIAMRDQLRMHEEGIERLARLARDLEVQTEDQIESRRSELQTASADFDPLELDRYTRFQELARSISEAVTDTLDGHREMVRLVTEQDNAIAYQGRALQEVQSALHRTRLLPFETHQQRLEAALAAASRDLGKAVRFHLSGGMVELDRLLLDRLLSPLEHILRNAVAHGIESPEERRAAGKDEVGVIRVSLGQEPGRAHILVEDDGRGLDIGRIRAKAIEGQLWDPDRPMDAQEAADMVCRPKFSTASTVTQTAGRGVGMDVVRQDILRLGGTFEMRSTPGVGLSIAIQVPTTVATTSVIVASVGPEHWAIPVGIIDDVVLVPFEQVVHARSEGAMDDVAGQGERIPYVPLADLMGVPTEPRSRSAFVLILREGTRRLAVEVDEVSRVIEAPLRMAGPVWARVPGVVGAAILQDGSAAFVIDPLRAPDRAAPRPGAAPRPTIRRPLVLVVDDSVTVRKAATQFLEKSGYDVATAKDGQEALEILGTTQPSAMLLDVEMPRMDGFECARNVREGSRNKGLPIIMVTSRQAAKHRQRAEALGVDGYLSKPFQEDELLALLHSLAPLRAPQAPSSPAGA